MSLRTVQNVSEIRRRKRISSKLQCKCNYQLRHTERHNLKTADWHFSCKCVTHVSQCARIVCTCCWEMNVKCSDLWGDAGFNKENLEYCSALSRNLSNRACSNLQTLQTISVKWVCLLHAVWTYCTSILQKFYSTTNFKRSVLFIDTKQRTVVIPYRRFGTTHRFHLNPSSAKLNPICHLLALLEAHPILHVSRIRVKQFRTPRRMLVLFGLLNSLRWER
jgi:hypothetical protein